MAFNRIQAITHVRTDALVTANGAISKPASGALYKGELAINANDKDPTLFIGTTTNATVTDKGGEATTTAVAEFKSLAWLQTNIIGAVDPASVRTLKYLSDTLNLLAADSDNVMNTWAEISAFLSTVPGDTGYDIMSLFNNKANLNLCITTLNKTPIATTAITGNGTTATATFAVQASAPFAVGDGIVISGASYAAWNGTWVVTACTTTTVSFASANSTTATVQGKIAGTAWYSENTTDGAKLYDNKSIVSVTQGATALIPEHAQLKVNVATIIPDAGKGAWVADAWVAPVYADSENSSLRPPRVDEVRTFYNLFNQMFTFDGSKIRANYELYGVAGVSALGEGTVGGGGGSGLVDTVLKFADLGTTLSDADYNNTFNAYTINKINSDLVAAVARIASIESGAAMTYTISGTGNAVTSVSKTGSTVSFVKGGTFVLDDDVRLTNARKNPFSLTFTGSSTAVYDGSAAISVALPTKTSQLTNDSAFLTAITKAQVEGVLIGPITSHTHAAYLTGNQSISLTGDITASGTTSISISIGAAIVTGKLLTGYAVATNEAVVAATDSILTAFGKLQKSIDVRPIIGNAAITTVGTIGTGTWNATAIGAAKGGTGLTTYVAGDLLYASGTAAISRLAAVAVGNVLISSGIGVAPVYGKVALASHVAGTLGVANGGTGLTAIVADSMLYTSAANTLAAIATTPFGRSLLSASSATTFANLAADTAATLKTARKISVAGTGILSNGVDFDGSAAIAIDVSITRIDGGTF